MHRFLSILLAACFLAIPLTAGAQAFSVVVEGFPSFPVSGEGVLGTREKINVGIGGRAEALYHVTSWLKSGIGIGFVANRTDVNMPATANLKATLQTIPIHAVVQPFYDSPERAVGFFGSLGLGFIDSSLQAENAAQSGNLSQVDFSFLVGGGATYAVNDVFSLRLSIKYVQSFTKNGDVWARGADPKAVYLALGGLFERGAEE